MDYEKIREIFEECLNDTWYNTKIDEEKGHIVVGEVSCKELDQLRLICDYTIASHAFGDEIIIELKEKNDNLEE